MYELLPLISVMNSIVQSDSFLLPFSFTWIDTRCAMFKFCFCCYAESWTNFCFWLLVMTNSFQSCFELLFLSFSRSLVAFSYLSSVSTVYREYMDSMTIVPILHFDFQPQSGLHIKQDIEEEMSAQLLLRDTVHPGMIKLVTWVLYTYD